MSHQVAAVFIPPAHHQNPEKYIEDTFEPHQHGDVHSHLYWDWYEIGGRWAGAFFPDGTDTGTAATIDRNRKVYTYVDENAEPHSHELYRDRDFHPVPGFTDAYLQFLDRIGPDAIIAIVDYHN